MDAAAVSASLAELEEELAFPESVRAVTLKDAAGAAHTLGALLDATPRAALVLGRNLLWYCIRDWMEDAARGLDLAALAAATPSVALIVVLPVPLWALQRYVREKLGGHAAFAARLFADEGAAAYKAFACPVKFATKKLRPDSIHAHTSVGSATWRGLLEGLRGGMQGDPRQLGLAAVVDGGARVVWAHRDAFNADQVPIPVLVAAAGAPPSAYVHHAP